MNRSGGGGNNWIETLFDPSHPNIYLVTLPVLALFALGQRKLAIFYLVGVILWKGLRTVT